jgi:hypothetical protein
MNRRVHKFFAGGCLVLAGAFVALSSSGWAAASSSPVIRETSTVQTVLQEDDPGWDCATMGNKTCGPNGPTDAAYLSDAWASFNGEKVADQVGLANGFRASYAGTYSTQPDWQGYVVVPSLQYPDTFHVFKIDVG